MSEISSIIEFLEAITELSSMQVYRGQAREEWELSPSIARIQLEKLDSKYQTGWRGIEDDLLTRFQKHAVRFLEKEPKSKIEWMMHAQHHGVPTRLLDWSTNPLKALYFAVENPEHDDTNGIVFIYYPRGWRTSSKDVDGEEEKVITSFHPQFINERIVAQDGCFTLFPFPRKLEDDTFSDAEDGFMQLPNKMPTEKIVILKEAKKLIRKQLYLLGITDVSMFPDLDGLAKSIRRDFGCM